MVSFDAGSIDRLGELAVPAAKAGTLIVVDHHASNTGFGAINVIDPFSAASAQLVHELIGVLGWPLDAMVATCLLTGLVTDTGRFQYSNTSPATMRAAADLVEAGARPELIGRHVYEEAPFGFLAVEATVLGRAVLEPERALVWSVLLRSDLARRNIGIEDTDPLIDALRVAAEAEVARAAQRAGGRRGQGVAAVARCGRCRSRGGAPRWRWSSQRCRLHSSRTTRRHHGRHPGPAASPLVTLGRLMDGFVLVDKPGGLTSHDVVAAVRRAGRARKVGHAGTLDPMATGLLVLGVGRATRLLRFIQDLPKEYIARALFGVATDTLDADGAVLSREPMPVAESELRTLLDRFTGVVLQVPPMASAVQVGGRRLYEMQRAGLEVDRQPRQVVIHQSRARGLRTGRIPGSGAARSVGKGTYIRVLADDLARAMGGRAHLTELRRTAIGSLRVSSAAPLDTLVADIATRGLEANLLAPAEALGDLPWVTVDSATGRGSAMAPARGVRPGEPCVGPFRVLDESGRLLAVYREEGRLAVPEVVLDEGAPG